MAHQYVTRYFTGANVMRTSCCSAVLDEVDILFNDEDFEAALESLINSSPVTTQYLFVTATLPLGIYNKLVESFPDCKVVMAPGMHRVSPGLEEVSSSVAYYLNYYILKRCTMDLIVVLVIRSIQRLLFYGLHSFIIILVDY